MNRKALVVGIDYYSSFPPLCGCVNDACAVQSKLERHFDGTLNFSINSVEGKKTDSVVDRRMLRESIRQLFEGEGEVALFFFAGHGHIEKTGGYLCAGDCKAGDEGIPLADIMTFATGSSFEHKVIILDSCHGGIAGSHQYLESIAELKEGVTILTASTSEQYASEENGTGVFTSLLIDALDGAASNLVGDITLGSVYAHIDQSLGPWSQRPVFKTNVKRFISLRKAKPPIDIIDLRRITEFFPSKEYKFQLDPTFEPERPDDPKMQSLPKPDPEKTNIFAILQKYNRHNLLVPIDAPHMWHAAMQSKQVKLTSLGEHYRRLAMQGRI